MNITQFENRLRLTIASLESKNVVSGNFCTHDGKYCPVGALAKKMGVSDAVLREDGPAIGNIIGMKTHLLNAFIEGFDGDQYPTYGRSPYFRLGQKMRKEFIHDGE